MKILSFKSGSLLKKLQPPKKQTGRQESCSLLQKFLNKIAVYEYALKYMYLWLSKPHMRMHLIFSLPSYGNFGLSNRLCRLIMICIIPLVQLCPFLFHAKRCKNQFKMYNNLCKMFVSLPMISLALPFSLSLSLSLALSLSLSLSLVCISFLMEVFYQLIIQQHAKIIASSEL